jgi:hypothetical protein
MEKKKNIGWFFGLVVLMVGILFGCQNPEQINDHQQEIVSETEEIRAGKAIVHIKLPMSIARSAYTDGLIAETTSMRLVIFKNLSTKVFEKTLTPQASVILELTTGDHSFVLTAYKGDEILGQGEKIQDLVEGANYIWIDLMPELKSGTTTVEAGWLDLSSSPFAFYANSYTVEKGETIDLQFSKFVDRPLQFETDANILRIDGESIYATAVGTAEIMAFILPYWPIENFLVRVVSSRLPELNISITRGETTKSQVLSDEKKSRGKGLTILHCLYGAQELSGYFGQYINARLLGSNGEEIAEQRFDFNPTSSWGAIPAEAHDFFFDLDAEAINNIEAVELTLYDGDYYGYITDVDITFLD